jgi:hypothetical protein
MVRLSFPNGSIGSIKAVPEEGKESSLLLGWQNLPEVGGCGGKCTKSNK